MENDKIYVKINDKGYGIDFTKNLKTFKKKLLPIIKESYKDLETITFDNLFLLYLDSNKDMIGIFNEKDFTLFLKYNKETCLEIKQKKDFDDNNEIDEIDSLMNQFKN